MQEREPDVPRFIVGMSRAGTNWIARVLNEHPDAVCFGESAFWGRGYERPGEGGMYDARQLRAVVERLCRSRLHPTGSEPGSLRAVTDETRAAVVSEAFANVQAPITPIEVFRRYCSAIARAEGKRVAIEKTPHHVNWVDRIVQAIPATRIIAMTRGPYEFMLSYKHQGDRKPEEARRRFRRSYHPLGCALVWRGYMCSIADAAERFPDHVSRVNLDEIVVSDAEVSRVQTFLQLPVHAGLLQRVPSSNTSFPDEPRPQLAAADLFWMRLVASRTMRRAGFKPQPVPLAPGAILLSFVRIPLWATRVFWDLRGRVSGGMFRYFWRWIVPASRTSPARGGAMRRYARVGPDVPDGR